jgi:acyl-coenzyme A thioesterase PaaI-like protein
MPMKNMERWLGDGGMGIIAAIGGSINAYGMEDGKPDSGWATGAWTPTELACNPHGIVQAGVHSILHDALMNFAINTVCEGKDRTRATLEMKTELIRAAKLGDLLVLVGDVVRVTKLVAFAEARVMSGDDLVSKSTGTFLLHREP